MGYGSYGTPHLEDENDLGLFKTFQWKPDNRVANWFLMDSPIPVIMMTLIYLAFVAFGPRIMKNYQAWNLRQLVVIYNFGLVALSMYMFCEFMASSVLQPNVSPILAVVDYSDKPEAVRLASVIWWYFFSKVIEFFDTIIFILRKKNNQITFLHVYHHSTMAILWWVAVKFVAGGECYFPAMINSLVHVLMYTYYGMSALGPRMQKYLWWKKYLTKIQMAQLLAVVIKCSMGILLADGFPKSWLLFLIAYMISQFLLFMNFYNNSYAQEMVADVPRVDLKKTKDKKSSDEEDDHSLMSTPEASPRDSRRGSPEPRSGSISDEPPTKLYYLNDGNHLVISKAEVPPQEPEASTAPAATEAAPAVDAAPVAPEEPAVARRKKPVTSQPAAVENRFTASKNALGNTNRSSSDRNVSTPKTRAAGRPLQKKDVRPVVNAPSVSTPLETPDEGSFFMVSRESPVRKTPNLSPVTTARANKASTSGFKTSTPKSNNSDNLIGQAAKGGVPEGGSSARKRAFNV